jgi:hypothetical protein
MEDLLESHVAQVGAESQPKRSRVLLNCAPCRQSKLKCDRAIPCSNVRSHGAFFSACIYWACQNGVASKVANASLSQCLKKGRTDGCIYAPKPQKVKPAKGMAARLKRLEGMVRGMMDGEVQAGRQPDVRGEPAGSGRVVQGDRGTTYVGATHFMAMLDDVSGLY